jgi:hypothetical protein
MELPKAIKDAINSTSSIEPELANLLIAVDDQQMLTIAHRIRAKIEVRRDIGFDIEKAIMENE